MSRIFRYLPTYRIRNIQSAIGRRGVKGAAAEPLKKTGGGVRACEHFAVNSSPIFLLAQLASSVRTRLDS